MSQKYIYLIRHGETEFNKLGIVQGSNVDSDLNDMGRMQAALFYEKYKETDFDKIYTSALKRTWQSVERFVQQGIPWEIHSGLNEISWGDQDGKVSNSQMSEYYKYVSAEWASGNLDLQIGGGESPNQVAARQIPILELMLSRTDERQILVCMHGRAMRILLCKLLNLDLKLMDTFPHHNLCLYILRWQNDAFELVKSNDISHLESIKR